MISGKTVYAFTLPIYYTFTFKRKKPKIILVNMNWYRNAYFIQQNEVKTHYHQLVTNQCQSVDIKGVEQYRLNAELYYKNPICDGSNIVPLMEKFLLDSLIDNGIIVNDTVKNHIGTNWEVKGNDPINPRISFTLYSRI